MPPSMYTSVGASTPVLILDMGSRNIKTGLHTSTAPHLTPALVGTPRYPRCLPGPSSALRAGADSEAVVGHEAVRRRGLLRLSYPIQHGGVVTSWSAATPLLRQSVHDALQPPPSSQLSSFQTLLGDGTAVVYSVVEPPMASRPQRARLAELLFEGGGDEVETTKKVGHSTDIGPRAAGVFCGVGPLLSLYATGRTSGLVIDVGDGAVSTAAAVDGYALTPCLQHERGGASGAAMTSYLTRLLYQSGVLGSAAQSAAGTAGILTCSSPSALSDGAGAGTVQERERVYAMKEACCTVAASLILPSAGAGSAVGVATPSVADLNAALIDAAHKVQQAAVDAAPPRPFVLPDGQTVEMGIAEATQAAEVLFHPSLMGLEGPGVAEAVVSAVVAAPAELQSTLLSNIVLTGGVTCCPGFGKRVFHELQERTGGGSGTAALPVLRSKQVCVTAPEQRAYAGWLGASFVAQLPTFMSDMVVSRSAYEEEGEAALAKNVLT